MPIHKEVEGDKQPSPWFDKRIEASDGSAYFIIKVNGYKIQFSDDEPTLPKLIKMLTKLDESGVELTDPNSAKQFDNNVMLTD